MKQCHQAQLDWMLDKRRIWLGKFEYGRGIIHFAFNNIREDCYFNDSFEENYSFGYEIDKENIIRAFVYESISYRLSTDMRVKARTPVTKRLTTTMDVMNIIKNNELLRDSIQMESALSYLAFSLSMKNLIDEDLEDLKDGTHLLPEDLIVEPDLSVDIKIPPISVSTGERLESKKTQKTIIFPFKKPRE